MAEQSNLKKKKKKTEVEVEVEKRDRERDDSSSMAAETNRETQFIYSIFKETLEPVRRKINRHRFLSRRLAMCSNSVATDGGQ